MLLGKHSADEPTGRRSFPLTFRTDTVVDQQFVSSGARCGAETRNITLEGKPHGSPIHIEGVGDLINARLQADRSGTVFRGGSTAPRFSGSFNIRSTLHILHTFRRVESR